MPLLSKIGPKYPFFYDSAHGLIRYIVAQKNTLKDIINPYNYFLKKANFSIITSNK